ncbi:MAG: hypothetical protein FWE23_04900 [Chitinivibrionia bacterium]|nr:hypothetical protein [Chitinivibrionia bacterium]
MKFSKVFLVVAAASAMVFAQNDADEWFTTPPPPAAAQPTWTAPAATSPTTTRERNRNRNIGVRVSGDLYLNPGFEFANNYRHREEQRRNPDGSPVLDRDGRPVIDTVRVDNVEDWFDIMYNWNVRLGLDFNERVSLDFRFSNPAGYAGNNMNRLSGLWRGSEVTTGQDDWFRGWSIPRVPNAFITLRPNSMFSFYGGLLEIKGNTALDFVAGVEQRVHAPLNNSAGGLWTSYQNWNAITNASQVGLKMDVELSPDFTLNFAALAPTDVDFRFIFGADIGLGALTLSPIITLRSFDALSYSFENIDEEEVFRTPVLFTYGADLGIELSDAFNLEVGAALGHIRLHYDESETNIPGVGTNSENERLTGFGFLLRAAPTMTFGINEIAFSYSFGVARFTDKEYIESNVPGASGSHTTKSITSSAFNDLALDWNFRLSDNFAFGPQFAMAFRRDRYRVQYDNAFPSPNLLPSSSDDIDDNKRTGLRAARLGLGFTANF